MASSRPRLVSNNGEPSDIKFYRLSLEREQARARRLTTWLVGALALSLVLNGGLALWMASSNRRTDAASDARSRVSAEELSTVHRQVATLADELESVRGRLQTVSESKIGTARKEIATARKEMSELRRCFGDVRSSLRRSVVKSNKRNAAALLKGLKLPACDG